VVSGTSLWDCMNVPAPLSRGAARSRFGGRMVKIGRRWLCCFGREEVRRGGLVRLLRAGRVIGAWFLGLIELQGSIVVD